MILSKSPGPFGYMKKLKQASIRKPLQPFRRLSRLYLYDGVHIPFAKHVYLIPAFVGDIAQSLL